MTDQDPFASFRDRLKQTVAEEKPAEKDDQVRAPLAKKATAKKPKPTAKKGQELIELSPSKPQEKLRLSKLIAPSITEVTWLQLGTVLESAHNAGDYRYQTEQAIVRTAIMAYVDGMPLSKPVGEGGKNRRSVYVTEPEHAKYVDKFANLGFKKSEIVERAVLTFIAQGMTT